ncbi:MAG: aminoglycoside phosphotransferase family protein [Planctomycetaceae bacterium]|nr:aminoglycoside phosphotransferase family protein [Planctomycetaceae bacterium]
MATEPSFLQLLRDNGVVREPNATLTPLSGGVSSDICLVEDGNDRFVVKRALPKLKVAADWFADVNRNRYEWEFIRYVAGFQPDVVPSLRHWSAEHGYFAMEFLGAEFQNWKHLLLAGVADRKWARRAGSLLATIHRQSTGDSSVRSLFQTTPNFFQLRIEPYLLATAERHPELRSCFQSEARRLAETEECLVHGDFSPKNILISHDRMVLLDCEVAWYGDPAFDIAFMLNHFLLKALLHAPRDAGLRAMVESFRNGYQEVRSSQETMHRLPRLLLLLMLARVDGKSPVEYLNPLQQNAVRSFVMQQFESQQGSLTALTDAWFRQLLKSQT